jgi:hypothetical protein
MIDLQEDTVFKSNAVRSCVELHEIDEVLAAWRRHLALVEDRELAPVTRKSRWGEDYSIEQMLEHAVVHPMRHRIQLERLMSP